MFKGPATICIALFVFAACGALCLNPDLLEGLQLNLPAVQRQEMRTASDSLLPVEPPTQAERLQTFVNEVSQPLTPGVVGVSAALVRETDQSIPLDTLIAVPQSGTGTGPVVASGPGSITTIAGSNSLGAGYSGDGGSATSARLNGPQAIALDGAGDLYIVDGGNNVIRKVTSGGTIATV